MQTAKLLEIEDELYRMPKLYQTASGKGLQLEEPSLEGRKVFLFDEPLSNPMPSLKPDEDIELGRNCTGN